MIADLYQRLVGMLGDSERFMFSGDTHRNEEDFKQVEERVSNFCTFVECNRIYLSDPVCTLLDTFVDAVTKTVMDIAIYRGREWPSDAPKETYAALTNAYHAFEEAIPKAKKALEREFRTLFGVEVDKAHHS